jgi:putative PIN family toxin of toxin-antitoxin system
LLSELERVLRYPRLAVAFPQPEEVVGLVGEIAMLVKPGQSLSILRDEADNRLLEAAAEAAADYIVTGHPGLLALERYGTTIVITPRSFLEHLDSPA